MSNLTTEGCTCFTVSEGMIRAMRMPLSIHAARVVVHKVCVFGHTIVVIAAVFLITGTVPGFLVVTAFGLWLVDGMAISLILYVLCTRYRDLPPIVASVLQIAFFVSSIIWSPTLLAHRGMGIVLVNCNLIYVLLEIARAPLLDTPVTLHVWLVALSYSAILLVATTLVFMRARPCIAYWV